MKVPTVPVSSREEVILDSSLKVVKKKQISPSKRWCFTYNNYQEGDIQIITDLLSSKDAKYIIGREVGEKCGTPHLQCYIEFKSKIRPKDFLPFPGHWEKAIGTRTDNLKYCSKDGKFVTNMQVPKPIIVLEQNQMYVWQLDLLYKLVQEPDNRIIHWIWETKGKTGKSAFAKHMAVNYECICVGGKANDIFCGIAKYREKRGSWPSIVIVDCPRDRLEYMNYGAIEQVKNGLVFSGKYESDMLIFNSPHVVVFANDKPDIFQFSADRWRIKKINERDMTYIPPTQVAVDATDAPIDAAGGTDPPQN